MPSAQSSSLSFKEDAIPPCGRGSSPCESQCSSSTWLLDPKTVSNLTKSQHFATFEAYSLPSTSCLSSSQPLLLHSFSSPPFSTSLKTPTKSYNYKFSYYTPIVFSTPTSQATNPQQLPPWPWSPWDRRSWTSRLWAPASPSSLEALAAAERNSARPRAVALVGCVKRGGHPWPFFVAVWVHVFFKG